MKVSPPAPPTTMSPPAPAETVSAPASPKTVLWPSPPMVLAPWPVSIRSETPACVSIVPPDVRVIMSLQPVQTSISPPEAHKTWSSPASTVMAPLPRLVTPLLVARPISEPLPDGSGRLATTVVATAVVATAVVALPAAGSAVAVPPLEMVRPPVTGSSRTDDVVRSSSRAPGARVRPAILPPLNTRVAPLANETPLRVPPNSSMVPPLATVVASVSPPALTISIPPPMMPLVTEPPEDTTAPLPAESSRFPAT